MLGLGVEVASLGGGGPLSRPAREDNMGMSLVSLGSETCPSGAGNISCLGRASPYGAKDIVGLEQGHCRVRVRTL